MVDVPLLPSTPPPYQCKVMARSSRRAGGLGVDVIMQTRTAGVGTVQLELPADVGELSRLTGDLVGIIAALAARAEASR